MLHQRSGCESRRLIGWTQDNLESKSRFSCGSFLAGENAKPQNVQKSADFRVLLGDMKYRNQNTGIGCRLSVADCGGSGGSSERPEDRRYGVPRFEGYLGTLMDRTA